MGHHNKPYEFSRQWLSLDRAELLWLDTHDFLPAKPVAGAHCRALNSQDIKNLSLIKDFELGPQLAIDFDELGFVGIGIFVNDQLAGLSIFSSNTVPAKYNRHGQNVNGLNIVLPPGTRCLIKAIVLPEFRGQRLHSATVRYAIEHFGKDTVHTIVASYNTANKAFLSSCLNQGFERVGKSNELCVFGKSFYRLPKPIDSLTGSVVESSDDGAIVLEQAA